MGIASSVLKRDYFIAAIPPEPLRTQLNALKEEIGEKFHTRAALRSPPHLTLHMPFKWPVKREDELVRKLQNFTAIDIENFDVVLDGFGAFPPRVIFLNVESNMLLNQLQREVTTFCKTKLKLFNANYRDQPFHPHLTLAFRDLKKPEFRRAWDQFGQQSFKASFEVRALVLLRHTGKEWMIFREFPFG